MEKKSISSNTIFSALHKLRSRLTFGSFLNFVLVACAVALPFVVVVAVTLPGTNSSFPEEDSPFPKERYEDLFTESHIWYINEVIEDSIFSIGSGWRDEAADSSLNNRFIIPCDTDAAYTCTITKAGTGDSFYEIDPLDRKGKYWHDYRYARFTLEDARIDGQHRELIELSLYDVTEDDSWAKLTPVDGRYVLRPCRDYVIVWDNSPIVDPNRHNGRKPLGYDAAYGPLPSLVEADYRSPYLLKDGDSGNIEVDFGDYYTGNIYSGNLEVVAVTGDLGIEFSCEESFLGDYSHSKRFYKLYNGSKGYGIAQQFSTSGEYEPQKTHHRYTSNGSMWAKYSVEGESTEY